MGLQEALTELEGVSPDEFAQALQNERSDLYKAIYSEGFGAGKSSVKDDLDSAQTQLEELQSERDKLQKRIEDLQGEQPEVGELRGKYEAKMEELQQKLQAKEDEIKQVRSEANETLRQKEQRFFQERAKNWLMSEGGVEDPDVAEIKIQKAMQDGRVKFDDDLNPKIYEPDGEVPTPISDGTAPHVAFGKSLLEDIPEKFIRDPRPGSSGLGGTNGTGGKRTYSREEIKTMSDEEFLENKADIQAAMKEGRIRD